MFKFLQKRTKTKIFWCSITTFSKNWCWPEIIFEKGENLTQNNLVDRINIWLDAWKSKYSQIKHIQWNKSPFEINWVLGLKSINCWRPWKLSFVTNTKFEPKIFEKFYILWKVKDEIWKRQIMKISRFFIRENNNRFSTMSRRNQNEKKKKNWISNLIN